MSKEQIQEAEGQSIEGNDDHWTVECPSCNKEYEYKGFFDSGDITECSCGIKFRTKKLWINDSTYIK